MFFLFFFSFTLLSILRIIQLFPNAKLSNYTTQHSMTSNRLWKFMSSLNMIFVIKIGSLSLKYYLRHQNRIIVIKISLILESVEQSFISLMILLNSCLCSGLSCDLIVVITLLIAPWLLLWSLTLWLTVLEIYPFLKD